MILLLFLFPLFVNAQNSFRDIFPRETDTLDFSCRLEQPGAFRFLSRTAYRRNLAIDGPGLQLRAADFSSTNRLEAAWANWGTLGFEYRAESPTLSARAVWNDSSVQIDLHHQVRNLTLEAGFNLFGWLPDSVAQLIYQASITLWKPGVSFPGRYFYTDQVADGDSVSPLASAAELAASPGSRLEVAMHLTLWKMFRFSGWLYNVSPAESLVVTGNGGGQAAGLVISSLHNIGSSRYEISLNKSGLGSLAAGLIRQADLGAYPENSGYPNWRDSAYFLMPASHGWKFYGGLRSLVRLPVQLFGSYQVWNGAGQLYQFSENAGQIEFRTAATGIGARASLPRLGPGRPFLALHCFFHLDSLRRGWVDESSLDSAGAAFLFRGRNQHGDSVSVSYAFLRKSPGLTLEYELAPWPHTRLAPALGYQLQEISGEGYGRTFTGRLDRRQYDFLGPTGGTLYIHTLAPAVRLAWDQVLRQVKVHAELKAGAGLPVWIAGAQKDRVRENFKNYNVSAGRYLTLRVGVMY
jgi:hypothetical protein